MSKTKNFQLGGGTFSPGQGVFDNQIKPWRSTSDKLTLKDLIDRPNYYLDKTAKYFNLNYNKLNDQKDPLLLDYNNKKGFKNPNNDTEASVRPEVLTYREILRGNLYGQICKSSKEYLEQYRSNFYQISYLEIDGNEKLTRPIRYSFTAQEIQTIIDEDLVSGSSGFYVSKMGDLTEPRYGPFILQSKSKGVRNEIYIRPELQTDPSFISGSMGGYRGDPNEYATLDITYHKTGIQEIEVEGFARELRADITTSMNFDCLVYDLAIGAVTYQNKRSSIVRYFTKNAENGGEYRGTGAIWEPANTMVIPHTIYKDEMTRSMKVHFDSVLDDQDSTKEIKITNATDSINRERIQEASLYENGTIPTELWADRKNYKNLYHHQYGAPFCFWGHKYDVFDFIRIDDSHQLKSFRIPAQHMGSTRRATSLMFTDCPNLEYIYFHPHSFPNVKTFIISGCGTDWLNDYHNLSPKNENHDTKHEWRHIFNQPPVHARCPYYNGLEVDLPKDEFFPNGCPPFFISNKKLKLLNLGSNKLNQTGIYHALKSALHCNRTNGYFNAKDQETRNGPENAVIYTGVHDYIGPMGALVSVTGRPDAYMLSDNLTFEENPKYENAPTYDLNNNILALVERLELKGWRVDLDYTDEKYNINGNYIPNFDHVKQIFLDTEAQIGPGAVESMLDMSYYGRDNSTSSSQNNSSSSYSSDD
ncbi:MAG: hypothetical protein P8P37_02445 [Candidatus Marinimicrobia bacterium]|nr:hypothetical protein [Candidatus Neomarinimicrobiota bacterium]